MAPKAEDEATLVRSFIALKASEQVFAWTRGGGGAWGFRVRAYGVWGGGFGLGFTDKGL